MTNLTLEDKIKIESEILFVNHDLPVVPELDFLGLAGQFADLVEVEVAENQRGEFLEAVEDLLVFVLNELRNICLKKSMLPKVEAFSEIRYYFMMDDYFNSHRSCFIDLLDFCFEILKENVVSIYKELIINIKMVVEYVNTYKQNILEPDYINCLVKQAVWCK